MGPRVPKTSCVESDPSSVLYLPFPSCRPPFYQGRCSGPVSHSGCVIVPGLSSRPKQWQCVVTIVRHF